MAYHGRSTTRKEKFLPAYLRAAFPLALMLAVLTGCFSSPGEVSTGTDSEFVAKSQLEEALSMMLKEIRNAGYDPRRTAGCGILTAAPGLLTFTLDRNGDGDIADDWDPAKPEVGEQIRYTLNSRGVLCRGDGNSPLEPVAADVSSLLFTYMDEAGEPTPEKQDIRAIKVTLVGRGSGGERGVLEGVYPDIMRSEASAASSEEAGRVLLYATARCRNLGLPSLD